MKYPLLYIFLSVVLLGCLNIKTGYAQLVLSPNYSGYTQPKNDPVQKTILTGRTTALSLPFFEDFSTSSVFPNPNLWQTGGGVFINNQFAVNPPSLNVATFDGLDAKGVPYNFALPLQNGPTDTLTSQIIDLSSVSNTDNVYMGFYWQADGLGELPDTQDSIRLQFIDNNANWITIWSQAGGKPTAPFANVYVPINDSRYLHANFQFRFQAFGRQSGGYDTWHIDYIKIDYQKFAGGQYSLDATLIQQPGSILKRYSAMPISQFIANPAQELKDSISTNFTYLNNSGFRIVSHYCVFKDTLSNTSLGTSNTVSPSFPILFSKLYKASAPVSALNKAFILANTNPKVIKYKFYFDSGDTSKLPNPRINFTLNDTISGTTALTDYYSYDDGTAEYGAGINQRLGKVAYRYILNTQDTLTSVKVNFAQLGENLTGESFVLVVWKKLDNAQSSILAIKSFPFKYPSQKNQFLNFQLDVPVVVSDTFYVGWQQTSDKRITVGFDRNTDSNNQIFYSLSSNWIASDTTLHGSLLLRPVFGTVSPFVITALNPNTIDKEVLIYPNPNSQGLLYIKNIFLKELLIYDAQGRLMISREFESPVDESEINIQNLPPGLYLLRCVDEQKKIYTKRLVVN